MPIFSHKNAFSRLYWPSLIQKCKRGILWTRLKLFFSCIVKVYTLNYLVDPCPKQFLRLDWNMNLQQLLRHILIQAQSVFATTPVLKYVILAQSFGFVFGLISPVSDLFTLVPITIFRLHLWRFVTNLCVESNALVCVWSAYCFHQFVVYIEPNWPLTEIVKYAIIVQLGTVFSIVTSSLFLFIFTDVVFPFYDAPTYGTGALGMAAIIALKQFLPDTVLLTTPFGRLKNGHLPITSISISLPLWLFGLLRGTVPFQLIFSTQIAWTYLRFFQSRGGMPETMSGDMSEHFTWASLFPRRVQPLANLLGRFTFRALRRLGVLKRVIRKEHLDHIEEETFQMEALESVKVTNATTAVLAPESWDAERKRQKALRRLNERLALATNCQSPSASSSAEQQGNFLATKSPASIVMAQEPYRMNNQMDDHRQQYVNVVQQRIAEEGGEEIMEKREERTQGEMQ